MPPVRRRVRAALANLGVEPRQKTKRSTTSATHTGSTPVKKPNTTSFNALPSAPEPTRPSLNLFVWGTGGAGEFGVGRAADYERPHRNEVVNRMIQKDQFGIAGAQGGLQAIAAGGMHSLFIDENGAVWSCGQNDGAALGRSVEEIPDPLHPGQFLDSEELPYHVQSLLDEHFRAVQIAAGGNTSAAVSSKGELRVWGSFRDDEGKEQFSPTVQYQKVPTSVFGPTEKIVSVAAGSNHMLALTSSGIVYTFGVGEKGQLGRKIIHRRRIQATLPWRLVLGKQSRRAVVIATGSLHSFAVDEDGDTWGWGNNSMGQTGTGLTDFNTDLEVYTPKKVIGLSKSRLEGATIVEIAGGDQHSLFLTSTGSVYACGSTIWGQLGLALTDPVYEARPHKDFLTEPALVTFPDGCSIVHVAAGGTTSLAVTSDGALYAWGNGTSGQLGTGTDSAPVPTRISPTKQMDVLWSSVSVGGQHSLGLASERN